MPRKWVKMWCAESLRGTIRFDLTPEERGVWYDLLVMAGDCRVEGYIAPNDEMGYPLEWIANTLNIPLDLLQITIKKCTTTGRVEETNRGLRIINWRKYQSEYDRQKQYRGKNKS